MADYQRSTLKFIIKGIDWARPVDLVDPQKYRILDNVRPLGNGQVWGRLGQIQMWNPATVDPLTHAVTTVHSIIRLNDPIPSPVQFPTAFHQISRILGSGRSVFIGFNVTTDPNEITNYQAQDGPGTPPGYSGNPVSFVIARPDLSARPFCFIGDSLQMRKVQSADQFRHWGIAAPNQPPTAVLGAANPNGPNGTFQYRYRARADAILGSGSAGNAGPAMRIANAITAVNQDIVVHISAAETDPQVLWLDFYRFSSNLPQWTYVGTTANDVGQPFNDTFSDAAIAGNILLEEDNFEPFPTIGASVTGSCNISGTTVTWVSGAQFNTKWAPGSQIILGGQNATTLYRKPDSATSMEVFDNFGTFSNVDFIVANPTLLAQPLAHVWGPFGGGESGVFLFACGDPLRPGTLYWTKGNSPEAAPDVNNLQITSPSEPLQSGLLYDGKSWCWSSDRMFQVVPSFGAVSDFIALEVPSSKGLYAPWAKCAGPKIWYRSRDGIYETSGGGDFLNITDGDLYPLFPHEDQSATFAIDGLTGIANPVLPPDDSQLQTQHLAYADGYLYFDYQDTAGNQVTLVYDTSQRVWISRDIYAAHPVSCHYLEEGSSIHNLLMGTTTGFLAKYSGTSDFGNPITGHVRSASMAMGDNRARKQFGDVEIDFDSNCEAISVELGFDNFTIFSPVIASGGSLTGRRRVTGDINSGTGQYAFNVGIDVTWTGTSGFPRLYSWEPSYLMKPELAVQRVSDWTDDGYPGAKWLQGCVLRADTLGSTRNVDIQGDGGTVGTTLSVTHTGETEIAYSFPPFITHLMRTHPQNDGEFWRVEATRWIWEPHPELATTWVTQETSLDLDGFFFHRDGYIALLSTAVVTLVVTVDNVNYTYTIPSTGGLYDRVYLVFQPMKGRMVNQYSLTSPSGFRLFQRDCEIRVGQWGRQGPMVVKNPFGDISRIKGAAI